MFDQSPVQDSLRQQLEARLRTDVAVDAFCLDYFPTVYHRFSKGMERTEKLNLLLSLEEPSVAVSYTHLDVYKRQVRDNWQVKREL